jgi:uncharacterized SAM-binding protein YcdF (DUF218 family)
MQKILATFSFLLLANLIWLFFRSGISNTFLLNLGFLLGAGIYSIFYDKLQKLRWLRYAIAISALLYASLGAFAMIYGRLDTVTFEEDAAIVLGTGLRGEEVSRSLQRRLHAAIGYHHQNPKAMIVVSGGTGVNNPISEAEAMARYLINAGVPPEIILQEDGSHSTYQNMRLSKAILDEHFPDGYRAVIITNDFHIYRALRFTRITGMEYATSLHGNTPLISLPGALTREVAAIIKMWLIGT